jgi:FecR protein
MKRTCQYLLYSFAMFLVFVPLCLADEFSENFISAKAGVLNYVEGQPLVFDQDLKAGKPLAARSQVRMGDRIETKETDRLEILLNPGSYLRLGPNSQLRVLNTDFGSMQFELARGTLILESVTFNKKVHALSVSTPSGDVVLLKDGLYRIEVVPEQNVEVLVHKGKLRWLKDAKEVAVLTSGKRFSLGAPPVGGEAQYVKLNRKEADVLDLWSRRRAEFLVAANSRLSAWQLGSVSQSYGYSLRGGWLYNPFFNCYTFVPFDGSFGSPYGFTYALFLPVRRVYSPSFDDPSWSAAGRGGYPSGRATTYDQRTTVTAAPSAPAPRVEAGRSEQESRSGTFDRMRNR